MSEATYEVVQRRRTRADPSIRCPEPRLLHPVPSKMGNISFGEQQSCRASPARACAPSYDQHRCRSNNAREGSLFVSYRASSHACVYYPPGRPSSPSRGIFLIISREPSLGPGWLPSHQSWWARSLFVSQHAYVCAGFCQPLFRSNNARVCAGEASLFVSHGGACVCCPPGRPSSTSRRVFLVTSRKGSPGYGWLPYHEGWWGPFCEAWLLFRRG